MHKKRNLLVNFLLLFAVIVVFFFAFEVVVRTMKISSGYDYPEGFFQNDELLDYVLTPDFEGEFVKQEFTTEIKTNSLGLMDVEYREKKENDFRILVLGDSFVWGGYGTTLNQTFVKIVERKLNDLSSKTNYQVINGGIPGYGTDQQLLLLTEKAYRLDPDLVILSFFVGNDFLNNLETNELTVIDGVTVSNIPGEKFIEKLRAFLLLNLHSYRIVEKGAINMFGDFIQKHISGIFQQEDYQAGLFLNPISKEMKIQYSLTGAILDKMKTYLESSDIRFALLLIPLKYQVDDGLKEAFVRNSYGIDEDFDFEIPQKEIIGWGFQNEVVVIDLLPQLKSLNNDNDFYWKLNPHFNVEGNEVVGDIVYNGLVDKSRLITRN